MGSVLIKNARFLIASPFNILENGAIFIEDDLIKAIGDTSSIEKDHGSADEVIDASDKIVMPGLIDSHTHIGECHMFTLFGFLKSPLTGIGDAAHRVVWPAWAWIPEEAAYDLEMFGLLNMLKTGTTTLCNSYMWVDESGRAAVDSGLRVELAPTLITSLRLKDSQGPEKDLEIAEASIQKWHGAADGRITYRIHPSATYNCHEWFLKECVALAQKYDIGLGTHVAESGDEADRAREVWPGGLIPRARDLGLMGPKSLFYHSCALDDNDIAIYAETGTKVAHNPIVNAMLGNVARVPDLMMAGVTVGLGTDMPTNDMFNVIRAASQFHAIMPRQIRGLAPWQPYELATVGSAAALNMEDKIGTLEPGKKADIITLDLAHNTRLFPLIPQVLLTFIAVNGSGSDVTDVIVDGKILMRDRELLYIDEQAIMARAQEWSDKFVEYYVAKAASGEPLYESIHEEYQP